MPNKWSITPTSGGASIDESGNAVFPRNKNKGQIVYTITYRDDCAVSTTVTQSGNTCSNYNYSKSSTTLSYSANSEGYFASSEGKYFNALSATSKPDWITVTSSKSNNIWRYKAKATTANMSGSQRSGTVIFKPSDSDLSCSAFSATVKQASVTCDNYKFSAITNSIGYSEGSSGLVATSSSLNNLAPLSASSKPSWVGKVVSKNISSSNKYEYYAVLSANTKTTIRTSGITFAPTDSSINCSSSFNATVKQEARSCSCSDFTWDTNRTREIDGEGGNTVITYTNNCGTVKPTINYYSGNTQISKPSYVTASITTTSTTLTLGENSSSQERSFSAIFAVNGVECSEKYTITQKVNCSSQWMFTSLPNPLSGWTENIHSSITGFSGVGIWIWKRIGGDGTHEEDWEEYSTDNPMSVFHVENDSDESAKVRCNLQIEKYSQGVNLYLLFAKYSYGDTGCQIPTDSFDIKLRLVPNSCPSFEGAKINAHFEKRLYKVYATTTKQVSTTDTPITAVTNYEIIVDGGVRCIGGAFHVSLLQRGNEGYWEAAGKISLLDGITNLYPADGTSYGGCAYGTESMRISINSTSDTPTIHIDFDPTKPLTQGCTPS